MKVRVEGFQSYNYGEAREEVVRLVTEDQIVTEDGAYLRHNGQPFTMHSPAWRIPREELQRLEAALAAGEEP